eukprot:TRINITY_DN339_c0_g1_i2.p1 TRINITY_DN339_c0_g1~~TRINITY_DN339_c0_g1_i2.p1  ORF type:complete len:291 (+),score=102.98 TRINITY_DN339_c0_g1_i2:48-920(+)
MSGAGADDPPADGVLGAVDDHSDGEEGPAAVTEARAPLGPPGMNVAPGGVHHVKNNSGKKHSTVYTPVLSLGDNRFEILKEGAGHGHGVDEEVAGMVSRLVHYIAFREATMSNSGLLVELEEYQKECWDRERLRDAEASRREPPRRGSNSTRPRPGKNTAPKQTPLEEELYFAALGVSLNSDPAHGFSCVPKPEKPTAARGGKGNDESNNPSAFTPVTPATTNPDHQDAFTKKLAELMWLTADTARTEKAPSFNKASKASSTPVDPVERGSESSAAQLLRSRTPPRMNDQ